MVGQDILVEGKSVGVHQAFLDGLDRMGTLLDLFCPGKNRSIQVDFQEPLYFLFNRARERMEVAGRDRDLPEKMASIKGLEAFADFVSSADAKHTIVVVDYASKIAERRRSWDSSYDFSESHKKMLYGAAICHDCAYPLTTGLGFRNKDIRVLHQEEGAREFRKLAEETNKRFDSFGLRLYESSRKYSYRQNQGFFGPDELEGAAHIISLHDSPPFKPAEKHIELLLTHREADRLWMVNSAGFALDLLRRLVESGGERYNPLKMLAHNVARHIEEAMVYSEEDRKKLGFKRRYIGSLYTNHVALYPTLYCSDIGFELFQESIDCLMHDYGISNGLFLEKVDERLKSGQKDGIIKP